MLDRRSLLARAGLAAIAARVGFAGTSAQAAGAFAVAHTDDEWHKLLTSDQYAVLRQAATEYPYSSPLLHQEGKGIFACVGCAQNAFSSTTKFDSGTGWPSFWSAIDKSVGTTRDTSLGLVRTAVHCTNCGGHLGHVFDDGPKPTGLRYCMNGIAMTFRSVSA